MFVAVPKNNGGVISFPNGNNQVQWSDDYFVSTFIDNKGDITKKIFIGSLTVSENTGWDLTKSDLKYEATFEYHPSSEKITENTDCKDSVIYDPHFKCENPASTLTQPAETGLLYKNPEGIINRPVIDEGRYEHERKAIFRYSSIGEFEDVLTDLDLTPGYHQLTDDRSVVSRSVLDKFVPEYWWEDPFTIIDKSEEDKDRSRSRQTIIKISALANFIFKNVDKITNFNPSTDSLEIDTDSFGMDSSATFAAGKNKKAVKKKLSKQDFDFLYDKKKGGLYFNENGSDKGFGEGGIIAIFRGAPDISLENLGFTNNDALAQ